VFGAIVMYIVSMLSLFKLRTSEPNLERSFRAPGYPIVPGIALVLAVVCLIAMIWFNTLIFGVFLALMVVGALFCAAVRSRGVPTAALPTGA
jgi:ethanolamine permease